MSSLELSQEVKKVVDFKKLWLRDAGWTKRNAEILATDSNLDWHFAVDLRRKCKDEDLCMRIIYGNG